MNIRNPYVPLEGEYWKFLDKKKSQGIKFCNMPGSNCMKFESKGIKRKSGKDVGGKSNNEQKEVDRSAKKYKGRSQSEHNTSGALGTEGLRTDDTRTRKAESRASSSGN